MSKLQIKQLSVTNFLNIPHLELTYPDNFLLITGRNGAGKTSIIEAIYYALTGKGYRGKNKNLLMKGQQQSTVILEFVKDNKEYKIVRKISYKNKMSSEAALYVKENGEYKQKVKGITAVNDYIVALFSDIAPRLSSRNFETFLQSILFVKQGGVVDFAHQNVLQLLEMTGYIPISTDYVQDKIKEYLQNDKGIVSALGEQLLARAKNLVTQYPFLFPQLSVPSSSATPSLKDKINSTGRFVLSVYRGLNKYEEHINKKTIIDKYISLLQQQEELHKKLLYLQQRNEYILKSIEKTMLTLKSELQQYRLSQDILQKNYSYPSHLRITPEMKRAYLKYQAKLASYKGMFTYEELIKLKQAKRYNISSPDELLTLLKYVQEHKDEIQKDYEQYQQLRQESVTLARMIADKKNKLKRKEKIRNMEIDEQIDIDALEKLLPVIKRYQELKEERAFIIYEKKIKKYNTLLKELSSYDLKNIAGEEAYNITEHKKLGQRLLQAPDMITPDNIKSIAILPQDVMLIKEIYMHKYKAVLKEKYQQLIQLRNDLLNLLPPRYHRMLHNMSPLPLLDAEQKEQVQKEYALIAQQLQPYQQYTERDIVLLSKQISDYKEILQLKQLKKEIQELEEQLKQIENKLAQYDARLEKLQQLLQVVKQIHVPKYLFEAIKTIEREQAYALVHKYTHLGRLPVIYETLMEVGKIVKNYQMLKEIFATPDLVDALFVDYILQKEETAIAVLPQDIYEQYLQDKQTLDKMKNVYEEYIKDYQKVTATIEQIEKQYSLLVELIKTGALNDVASFLDVFVQYEKHFVVYQKKKKAGEIVKAAYTEYVHTITKTFIQLISQYVQAFTYNKFKVKLEEGYLVAIDSKGYEYNLQQLSGGQQVVVGLSVILALHRLLQFDAPLFLDEPFINVDIEVRQKILSLLIKYKSIALITHQEDVKEFIKGVGATVWYVKEGMVYSQSNDVVERDIGKQYVNIISNVYRGE